MRKVVWMGAIAALAVVSVGVTPAAAQATPRTQRQQLRARIERRVEQRFRKLDANGNGVIDRGEWPRNAKLFDRFDRDHDGSLSRAEFRRFLIALGRRRLGR